MKKLINLKKNLGIVLVTLLGLVPLIWFWGKDGVLINGVDTNFPLDPLVWISRRFYVWNDIGNGGSDFSSSVAGIFFHLIQTIPFSLGLGLQASQIISLIFWFAIIVFGAYFLAKILFPGKLLIQLTFVILYSFNIYLFNTWENVKVANLALVAAVPFVLSTVILLWDNKITYAKATLYSVITGIIISGGGINPAYFFTLFLVLFIFFLPNFIFYPRQIILRRFGKLCLISSVIIGVNLFWILPTVNFIVRVIPAGNSLNEIGFSNWLNSLSENTSIVNVLRIQGAWDWYALDSKSGLPLFIPYALNYFYKLPFLIFSFLLPLVAIFSLVIADKSKRYLYIAFSLMFVIGIFLGAGAHQPTGDLFSFLATHIPFFTLFRSPWYIFTPLLTIAYAGLISLFFYSLEKQTQKFSTARLILPLLMVGLIGANLLYTYPQVTGKIFRPSQKGGFYINFPEYIFQSANWLRENNNGRIIGYPDDEIENFRWGYRGVDSILGLFSNNETVYPAFNSINSKFGTLAKEFYQSLKKEQLESAYKIAAKINVNFIFEKKDQDSLAQELPTGIKGLESVNFGDWYFYKLPEEKLLPKIFAASNIVAVNPNIGVEKTFGIMDRNDVVLNLDDNVVKKILNSDMANKYVILSENSQESDFYNFTGLPSILSKRLVSRDLSKTTFSFDVAFGNSYQPLLERFRLEGFGIDPNKDLAVEVDGQQTNFKIDHLSDSYVYYQPVLMSPGKHQVVIKLVNKNLVEGDMLNENNFTKGGEGKGEGLYRIEEDGQGKFLSITNIDKADINADFKVSQFDPQTNYYIQVTYKQIYGNTAQVLINQRNDNVLFKSQAEGMPHHPEWQNFSLYFEPVRTNSRLGIGLVAPHISDPLGTKVFYKGLKVYKTFFNKLIFTSQPSRVGPGFFLSKPEITFKKVSPVSYEADVSGAGGPHIIVFSENYSPEWKAVLEKTDGTKLPLTPLHFSANLYANAWYIDNVPESYKLKIYYSPQTLFSAGALFSVLFLFVPLLIYFVKIVRSKLR